MQIKTERVPIMFEKGLVEQIDDYGFKNRIRSRSEVIRRLVAESLENQRNEKAEAQS